MENINDFEKGQVFVTKKGNKMEVTNVINDDFDGVVELKMFVHKDSENCKQYGWGHNMKFFMQNMRLAGGTGLLRKLETEGWKLKK